MGTARKTATKKDTAPRAPSGTKNIKEVLRRLVAGEIRDDQQRAEALDLLNK